MVLVGEVVSAELVPAGLSSRVAEYVRQWLISAAGAPEDLRPPVEGENTYRLYRRVIAEWLVHCASRDIDPLDPGRNAVDEWKNLVASTPTHLGTLPARASMAARIAVLGSFYRFLLDEDVIEAVPIRRRTRVTAPKESQTVGLSAGEAAALEETLAAGASVIERATILTLLWQGLRISELLTMRVDALGHNKGERTMTVHGKGGRIRVISIEVAAGVAIDELLAARFGEEDPPPDVLLFTGSGVRLSRESVTRDIKRLARVAGIPSHAKLSPHSLRHTCATLMLDGGAALHEVQEFLGHASPETTGRYDRSRGANERSVRAQSGMRRHVTANRRPPGGS